MNVYVVVTTFAGVVDSVEAFRIAEEADTYLEEQKAEFSNIEAIRYDLEI